MQLLEAVEKALADMQISGIEGWGLRRPDHRFREIVISPKQGCMKTWGCRHSSHDPAAPCRKLIPVEGTLSYLGEHGDFYFYLLTDGQEVYAYRNRIETSYWAQIEEVPLEEIPTYLLATLAVDVPDKHIVEG